MSPSLFFFNNAEKMMITHPSDYRDLGSETYLKTQDSEGNSPQCDLSNFGLVGRSWFVFMVICDVASCYLVNKIWFCLICKSHCHFHNKTNIYMELDADLNHLLVNFLLWEFKLSLFCMNSVSCAQPLLAQWFLYFNLNYVYLGQS